MRTFIALDEFMGRPITAADMKPCWNCGKPGAFYDEANDDYGCLPCVDEYEFAHSPEGRAIDRGDYEYHRMKEGGAL